MPDKPLKPYQIAQREAAKAGKVGRYLVQDGVPTPFGQHLYAYQERADGRGRRIIRHDRLQARTEWQKDGHGR